MVVHIVCLLKGLTCNHHDGFGWMTYTQMVKCSFPFHSNPLSSHLFLLCCCVLYWLCDRSCKRAYCGCCTFTKLSLFTLPKSSSYVNLMVSTISWTLEKSIHLASAILPWNHRIKIVFTVNIKYASAVVYTYLCMIHSLACIPLKDIIHDIIVWYVSLDGFGEFLGWCKQWYYSCSRHGSCQQHLVK